MSSLYGDLHGKHYGRLYGESESLAVPPGGRSGFYGKFAGAMYGRFYGDSSTSSVIDVSELVPPLRARSALTPLSAAHNITDDFLRARTVPS